VIAHEGCDAKMACCPTCEAPLIFTFAFAHYEYYCLECGRKLDFLEPVARTTTPELLARHAALQKEWDTHVSGKLIDTGALRPGCVHCSCGESHHAHATDAERGADVVARAWLVERMKAAK
jgi:hypothetical protein